MMAEALDRERRSEEPEGQALAAEKDIHHVQNHLWEIADELRANSGLQQHEYKTPVLGLLFLKHADVEFAAAAEELEGKSTSRRRVGNVDYQARGVLYLPEEARFDHLLDQAEGEDVRKKVNHAMTRIMEENPELKDVLPRTYLTLGKDTLVKLLRSVNASLDGIPGDRYGKVYEYFLGKFAMGEGQRGGAFFTPSSMVRLIVEIIEPHAGRILDPACGSGGMFVQSADFVARHRERDSEQLSISGQEKTGETARLARMNLAVNGLSGDIKEANSYYEDPFKLLGRFDYVMANPPFNVNAVDKTKLEGDTRFPFGMPKPDNANYLWIQLFHAALNDTGRAGFVMPNSAGDARGSELEIRKELVESGAVDVIVAMPSNFFLTVTLPATLWFLDKGKADDPDIGDQVLFIDARKVYRQISRAHREFSEEQLEFLANIVRLYRGEQPESGLGSEELMSRHFPDGVYTDVPGLCAAANEKEIEAHGWSLNPGRYVGTAAAEDDGIDFEVRMEELAEEFQQLSTESADLTETVSRNLTKLLGGESA